MSVSKFSFQAETRKVLRRSEICLLQRSMPDVCFRSRNLVHRNYVLICFVLTRSDYMTMIFKNLGGVTRDCDGSTNVCAG